MTRFEGKMQWAREEEPSYTQKLVSLQEGRTKEEGHLHTEEKTVFHKTKVHEGFKSKGTWLGEGGRICLKPRTTAQLA